MKRTGAIAFMMLAVGGCKAADMYPFAERVDPPAPGGPSWSVDAGCDAWTLELRGYPAGTKVELTVLPDPPGWTYTDANGDLTSAPWRISRSTFRSDGRYTWKFLVAGGEWVSGESDEVCGEPFPPSPGVIPIYEPPTTG